MNLNTDDNDLRALFAALRQEEAQHTPAFNAIWGEVAARAERRQQRAAWMRYAAAAVLLVGLVFSAVFLLQPRAALSITEWQSPTAGLLPASTTMLDAGRLPTSALLTPPSMRLDAYVPDTQGLWPGKVLLPDTTSEQ